jgi:4'-phosphopantetheinyl transferase EntD
VTVAEIGGNLAAGSHEDGGIDAAVRARNHGGMLRDAWIGELFDDGVWTASCPVTDVEDDLLPEERLVVASAVAKRRREFAAGRRCARGLLAQLGHPGVPLLRNDDRTPRWPEELVGSISHCATLCIAAVARRSSLEALGVDVEQDAALEPPLWRRICTPAEIERLLETAPAAERGRIARLVFSAKEATYKALYPLHGWGFGFQDIEIAIDWETGRFTPRLDDTLSGRLPDRGVPAGRFARRGGFVVCAATLAAPSRT